MLNPSGKRGFWCPLSREGYDIDQLDPWFALAESNIVADPPPPPMHIAEQVRKSVLFLGTKEKGKFRPRATAFLVSMAQGTVGFRYLVTADHVVSSLKSKGHEIWLRANRTDGTAQEDDWSLATWFFHPDVGSTDVAIAGIGFTPGEDFRTVSLHGESSMAGNFICSQVA